MTASRRSRQRRDKREPWPERDEGINEYLKAAELHSLTGYSTASRQDAWLTAEGIPHRKVGGRTIVSRNHVRDWLEGRPSKTSTGPNWGALQHA